MVNFVLVHHTIPFIWAIILTHANQYHFSIIFIVMKNLVIVSDLCLTFVISFIFYLCIGAFNLQTTFNDSYLVQFILYQIKMMGEW